ncbi:uncharacterized protein LOC108226592 [Daucus carota subsp. sativus]|uniref:Uncharacterized protein n=1 Tax=Daucus carota subsp. sativus TaxID=79200 RepID=A0A164WEU1_DAUCS|nr:PREDICTED: uncharacterized protein LOC108226592 [Daucus carota subsp. sativus]
MATNITRLLGNNRAYSHGTAYVFNSRTTTMESTSFSVLSKMGFRGEKCAVGGEGENKPAMALNASVALAGRASTAKTQTIEEVKLAFILANVSALVFHGLKAIASRPRTWRTHIQTLIERVVINSRFFTMLAVAGTLLGSVLCFLEGCFIIIESYLQYLHALSHGSGSDHGHHMVQLLIEAMDMYLVGTAMLIFGTGLHVMFVGTNFKGKGSTVLPESNFFGLFHLQKLPTWIGMKSIAQAKTKIGHALMMILQVGVMEKFKSIPLITGLDLACFAGALFISSASIFLLSRLTTSVASNAASNKNVAQESTSL